MTHATKTDEQLAEVTAWYNRATADFVAKSKEADELRVRLAEAEKYKDEYFNLCKFANDLEDKLAESEFHKRNLEEAYGQARARIAELEALK